MIYAVYGFVAGFLIPYMSRRFAKFMPATPAYALYRLVKPNKTARKVKFSTRYKQLKRKYLSRSLVYGALSALLSLLAFWRLGEEHLFWYLTFVWILLLLAEIDLKMLLLPDILTIPLLIGGFVFAAFFGVNVSAEESAAAAMAGYVLPVVATLLMLWRSVDASHPLSPGRDQHFQMHWALHPALPAYRLHPAAPAKRSQPVLTGE